MPVGPFRRPPVAILILRPFGRGPSGLPSGRTFLERHLPELREFTDDQWLLMPFFRTSSAANAQGVVQLDAKRLDPQVLNAWQHLGLPPSGWWVEPSEAALRSLKVLFHGPKVPGWSYSWEQILGDAAFKLVWREFDRNSRQFGTFQGYAVMHRLLGSRNPLCHLICGDVPSQVYSQGQSEPSQVPFPVKPGMFLSEYIWME